jgi:two-component system, LuxR family, sensor kinase FixL
MGRPKEAIIGRTANQLVSARQAEIFRKAELKTMEKGQRITEARITFSDGSIHHVITTLNRFRWQNQQIGGIVGVMLDISKRKEMEEALKESEQKYKLLNKELEQVNQELKDFAYIVSHDLKAPLRGIHSLATWITDDYSDVLDEDGKEQLQLLMDRVNRMHDLIEGILQYSRVGNVHEEKTTIDLQLLLPEIIDLLSPPPHFSIMIETALPCINAEKTRIKQVFQNLISNGIKYNDKEKGTIAIGCNRENNAWHFYIRDNGLGIEKKHFETIFKMFQTINPKADIESTGIGLTIVKRIIELYGGTISVESEYGKGTTFYFTIPQDKE